jgi:ABC-type transport system involved in multi-copper enzyme maturation permease subunit
VPLQWPMINPIFLRVLTSSGRQKRHVWTRALYMVAILIALVVMMMAELGSSGGKSGLADLGELLFVTVSIGQLVLILFLSPIYTAGAISQERDAQTFGVLLTTPLSNLQIVMGTLLSRLFFVLAILFSTLPIFAMLYFFGGFEMRDILLSYAISGSSAVLAGAAAIAVTIVATGTRRVVVGFFLGITGYVVGLWVLDHMLLPPLVSGYTEGALDWLHPVGAMLSTLRGGQADRDPIEMLSFWRLLVTYPEYGYLMYSLSLSAAIITLAAVFVRRLARGYGGLSRRLGRIGLVAGGAIVSAIVCAVFVAQLGLADGLGATVLLAVPVGVGLWIATVKRHRKPRSVWDNPVAWRERVTRTATTKQTSVQVLYVVLSILALYVVLVMKVGGAPAVDARQFVLLATTTQMFVILMVASTMAAGCISYEREQGTLDVLLTTPITPRYFIHGKLTGIFRYAGMFLLMVLLISLGAFLIARLPVERILGGLVPKGWAAAMAAPGSPASGAGGSGSHVTWDSWPIFSTIYPVIVTAGMTAAMITVGMTFSLKARNTATAAVRSALTVLGVAAAMTLCCGVSGSIMVVGHMATLINPFLANYATLFPEDFMAYFNIDESGAMGTFFVAFGMHAGVVLSVVVYGLFARRRIKSMVRTFDLQTRQKL